MKGTLVISLDFELMWGVRDHRSIADYGDAVLGARQAIPQMLTRFEKAGIRATWATVGLLFARTRREMQEYAPAIKPGYRNARLSPYPDVETCVGCNEATDPYHFGRSLIERIRQTEGQEVATHTFSHYYCLEEGQTQAEFEADISAAVRIARDAGVALRSIVFPRNQSAMSHVDMCRRHGIAYWRGNPDSSLYSARPRERETVAIRAVRLLDSVAPLASNLSSALPEQAEGSVEVKASRFFRPYAPRHALIASLQICRILKEMTAAAEKGRIYHLWWHPHNFGRWTDCNLAALDRVLDHYRMLADRHGMTSATMADVGRRASQPR